ncbi:bifunctional folylpolyglutamate synthase/dihydrofolate synthase [Lyngbya confervoides]|uniref:Dihydrofolate synthase/folylpolyglutamate synthase n=1 Tax=Lyngbya confervoides BDU141951 TaxID=1574623 RepID=A0ABD4T252_9CYAN|nr:folylpolyglutamate synthase/dihydrofolate synthase family protein [Lyngbya confervoides]MCM1982773.1 bifunctional folylpolyglutamate synthase/dihydrofolate synthase [Lyngbya confervoides BDU141951]
MTVSNATITQILEKYERFGVDLSLVRIRAVLKRMGNPQHRVPMVHVTGTNGKGSVCAYLSSVLSAAGYKTGRFTSPHLVAWTERICLNNQPIAADSLLRSLRRVEAVSTDIALTQFEVITAAAWDIFAQEAVDIAVIEVGLGGRLDATNVCEAPLVTVITSLSLEHWQRLGPTLADIAGEKAGILKTGRPAVLGSLPEDAMAVILHRAKLLHCPLIQPAAAQALPTREGVAWATAAGVDYPLPLRGRIQLHNSALAIATLQCLQQQGWIISDAAIQAGMGSTHWAGRIQWTRWRNQPLLIDGAHNPAAAEILRNYMDEWCSAQGPRARVHWIVGMLKTKDHRGIFTQLLRPGDRLSLVPVAGHASASPSDLLRLVQTLCLELDRCETFTALPPALESALSDPEPEEGVVLCGSLYLLGEFLQLQTAQTSSLG